MMPIKTNSVLVLLLFFLVGCSASRFQKKGTIVNENFIAEIPFEYKHDVILVKVKIEGEDYNFMWDTGAELNVIDQSIADKISLKSVKNTKVRGSDNSSRQMGRMVIPSFFMGSIEVQESIAVISNFESISRFLGCLEIKGIIGNNVMRRANMQIDYEQKIITLTDDANALVYGEDAHVVKMNAGQIGNVKLKLVIGDQEQFVTFDTGYGGTLKSNMSDLLITHQYIKSKGITGASLHQVNTGIATSIYIDSGHVAGIPFEKQLITFSEGGSSLLGNEFLKHFKISTLWSRDELVFEPVITIEPDTIKPFELKITPNFNASKIEVGRIYKDYSSLEEALIGWQVDKINQEDVSDFNMEELCTYWDELTKELKQSDMFTTEISKDGESKSITVERIHFDHIKAQ